MPKAMTSLNKRVYREETLDAYERGIERAILLMHQCLGTSLTVDEMADCAHMSRYHFIRAFNKVTGVSPGRFLAAVRMQEAKRLLLQTDLSVTEISLEVGYNSLGTFTRIFADFVGFAPIRFRQLSRPLSMISLDEIIRCLPLSHLPGTNSLLRGEVVCNTRVNLVTVALFPTAIPRSQPIECNCLTESLRFRFNRCPPRGAHVFAVGLLPSATIEDAILVSRDHMQVGSRVLCQTTVRDPLTIELRRRRPVEPPVLVAFPLIIAQSLMANQMSTFREADRRTSRHHYRRVKVQ